MNSETRSASEGQWAEDLTAQDLTRKKFKVIHQNWKRPNCELDIVALKGNSVCFFEVKLSADKNNGAGYERVQSVGARRKFTKAVSWYLQENKNYDKDLHLIVASVDGVGEISYYPIDMMDMGR
jgi:Holliday junction resolvase-like predicted endonuclease